MESVQVSRSESSRYFPKQISAKIWQDDHVKDNRTVAYTKETSLFTGIFIAFEIFLFVIYGVWLTYGTNPANFTASSTGVVSLYQYFRDVSIMIFFGFGFLMTFLRKYAYSALGYTFLYSCLAIQWALPLRGFFDFIYAGEEFTHHYYPIGVDALLDALFCAGAVMITYGGLLGRTTPLQMLVITIIEPILYFLNVYIGKRLDAFDIGGGMFIHLFGAYFGLSVARFVSYKGAQDHAANGATYMSDQLAMAGTFFLWIMWPSFNAAVAPPGDPQLRAIVNTFISLVASVISTFIASRCLSEFKFEMVHIQNASLAGGVVMGVMAHLNINIIGAMTAGLFAGTISVVGYVYITPYLTRKGLQDTCGIHNLHGMPGFIGSIGAIFAAAQAVNNPGRYGEEEFAILFRAGDQQASRQAACTFIVLAIAISGGAITGLLAKYLDRFSRGMLWYEDTQFWIMPHAGDHGTETRDTRRLSMRLPANYGPAVPLDDLGEQQPRGSLLNSESQISINSE